MTTKACRLCGEPMPLGEEMFNFHGYSGPCPKDPLPPKIEILESITPLSFGDKLGMVDSPGVPYLMHLQELLDLAISRQAKVAFSECDLLIGGTEVLVLYTTNPVEYEPTKEELKAALRENAESC